MTAMARTPSRAEKRRSPPVSLPGDGRCSPLDATGGEPFTGSSVASGTGGARTGSPGMAGPHRHRWADATTQAVERASEATDPTAGPVSHAVDAAGVRTGGPARFTALHTQAWA